MNEQDENPITPAKWRAIQDYLINTTPEGLRKALLDSESKGEPQSAADLIWNLTADLRDFVEKEINTCP